MKNFGIYALFAAGVSAIPMAAPHHANVHQHHKRDIVWVTEWEIDTVTVDVTKTVWVDGDATSTQQAEASQTSSGTTTTVMSTPTVHPQTAWDTTSSTASAAELSTSVYEAPTTSSSSEYVAPTTTFSSEYVAPTTTSTSEYVAPTTTSISAYVAPTTTSTSAYVAPTTSSSSTSVYTPTSSYEATSTTSTAATATTSASSGSTTYVSGGYDTTPGTAETGDFTWYADGLGACGITNESDDPIVAISHDVFDAFSTSSNPNDNPLCGRKVSLTGEDGSQYSATVVDRCTGCAAGDLDLSEGFFNTVTNYGNGRVSNSHWTWED